ncbi:RsiV family protein [Pseudomonas sp. FEN]|uniref:RsiV family protein n=1 Tax=Pseudomonas sp. FEN TaxID=2767468 RepID=UPI00174C1B78|nr:DUF3298 domain-containing protein [Pseudomonas sp. FEN]CAD5199547.1 FIG00953656: hypothetical protein [Pseudomonas sp. FEN]
MPDLTRFIALVRAIPGRICVWCMTLCIALCMPCVAYAASGTQVYSGTLGKMPIMLEFDFSRTDGIWGRYFYQKYHSDLVVSGTLQGQDLELTEDRNDKRISDIPSLHLSPTDKGGWQGVWKDTAGKVLPIELTPAEIPPPSEKTQPGWQAIYDTSRYDYLRVQGLPLKAGKVETVMGHTLQWWHEPVSQLSMFEITSGYTAEQRRRINQQLRASLWAEVVNYNDCMLGGGHMDASFGETVTPHLLAPGVVSAGISSAYYCGAHPASSYTALNFDVKSGKRLTLENVLWVGKGEVLQDSHDGWEAYGDYRKTQLVPWLINQLKVIAPMNMKKPASEYECDFNDPDIWQYAYWYFTPKGINFAPYPDGISHACEGPEWSVVPYAQIKRTPGDMKLQLLN